MPAPPRPGLYLEESAFGSCRLELEDFTHAVRHEPRTRTLLRWSTWVGALACLSGLFVIERRQLGFGLALLGFGALCFALHNAPDHVAQRWFARTPSAARAMKFTVAPGGLIVSSELAQTQYGWSSLHGFHHTGRVLLVWVTAHTFLIIPERAFSQADLPRVVARLSSELGGPPELPRFWRYVALTCAAAAALLWLWNRLSPR